MSNKVNLRTVKGIVELLEQGASEVMADPSPDTARKWGTINQLLSTLNRTYALAFSSQRIQTIKLIDQANNHGWADLTESGLNADRLSGDILGTPEETN